jgi:hypothetical protein
MKAGIVMKDLSLMLSFDLSVLRSLLLNLSVITSVQGKGIGCTWWGWYLMLLNNNVGAMTRDIDSEIQMC